jgi:hypothetical protein
LFEIHDDFPQISLPRILVIGEAPLKWAASRKKEVAARGIGCGAASRGRSMIRKSVQRFSEKIMLNQRTKAG